MTINRGLVADPNRAVGCDAYRLRWVPPVPLARRSDGFLVRQIPRAAGRPAIAPLPGRPSPRRVARPARELRAIAHHEAHQPFRGASRRAAGVALTGETVYTYAHRGP